jgi:hypothetical protein
MTPFPDLDIILVCPRCRGALQRRGDGAAYLCPACRLSYPVRDGIPVMLVHEAAHSLEDEGAGQP